MKDIKPLRRIEHFLAKIAGSSYAKDLEPITRKEYWLNEIAKSGGGGGANVLTLYLGREESTTWAYKDPECTEKYATYEEALNAVKNADVIKAIDITDETSNGVIYTVPKTQWSLDSTATYVEIQLDRLEAAYLYYEGGK